MPIMVPGKALRLYLQNMITLHYPHIVQLYKVPEKQVEASKTCVSFPVPKEGFKTYFKPKLQVFIIWTFQVTPKTAFLTL